MPLLVAYLVNQWNCVGIYESSKRRSAKGRVVSENERGDWGQELHCEVSRILTTVVASIKYRTSYRVLYDARKILQIHRYSIDPFTRSKFCNPLTLTSVMMKRDEVVAD